MKNGSSVGGESRNHQGTGMCAVSSDRGSHFAQINVDLYDTLGYVPAPCSDPEITSGSSTCVWTNGTPEQRVFWAALPPPSLIVPG